MVDLVESAYRGDRSRAGWTTEADLLSGPRTSPAEITAAVSDAAAVLLLAEQAVEKEPLDVRGELLGCCRLRRESDTGASFGLLAVRPDRQDAGIGRLMVEESERAAVSDWQTQHLELWVLSVRHELIAWYERLGFRRTGATVPFPEHPGAGMLRADLVFEVMEKVLSVSESTAPDHGTDSCP